MREASTMSECDSSGLLGNYNYVSISLFGDTDSCLVPHSLTWRDVRTLCYRQGATCCHDMPVVDNDRSVVERGVLEEQIHYQTSVYQGIDLVAGFHYEIQAHLMRNDDECTGFLLGHRTACLGNLLYGSIVHRQILIPEELVQEDARAAPESRAYAEPHEKMADLRLEDDDYREHTHVDESPQERAREFHVQCLCEYSQDIDRDYCREYVHGGGIAYPSEYEVDEQGD